MTISCPAAQNISVASISPGNVIRITLAELGIETDNQAFFTNAFITLIDDADGNSVFPDVPEGDTPRPGVITNNGAEIFYTTDPNVQPGDVITIEYLAKDDDDNCEQTFTLSIGQASAALGDECDNVPELLNGSDLFVIPVDDGVVQPVTFDSLSLFFGPTTRIIANRSVSSPAFSLDPAIHQSGEYRLSYRLVDGNGNIGPLCETTFAYESGESNPQGRCADINDIRLPNGTIADFTVATGETLFVRNVMATDIVTGRELPDYPVRIDNRSIIIGGNAPDDSNVQITYSLVGSEEVLANCDGFRVIKSGATEGTANNLNCTASRFLDGQPNITCGAAATVHTVYLEQADGSPLTLPAESVQFNLSPNTPEGVTHRFLSHDGRGNYQLEIDPSQANCAGTTDGSILV